MISLHRIPYFFVSVLMPLLVLKQNAAKQGEMIGT